MALNDNDWLKYNASEYTVNGKTYRNLEAQVLKNKEDIEAMDVTGIQEDITQLQEDVASKQDKLTAGSNITIDAENEISATDTTYSAGSGISISAENVISAIGTDRFDAVLGTTTYDEIYAAYAANKIIFLDSGVGATMLPLVSFSGTRFVFAGMTQPSVSATTAYMYKVVEILSDDTYNEQWFTRVTSASGITASATSTSVPTTNAVYDFVVAQAGVQKRKATIILNATDWTSGGGGEYIYQTVSVTGMTADADIIVSPLNTQASTEDYAKYQIICTAQTVGQLTFTSYQTTIPTNAISVNLLWFI